MADDPTVDNGVLTDYIVSADECPAASGKYIQRMKLCYGADGDATMVGADANGLDVDVVRLPTAADAIADNAGFTDGTSKVLPAGFIFDEVAGTGLTENDTAAARIDSKRAQVGVVEDATTRGQRAAVSAAGRLSVDASGVAVPITDNAGSLTVDAPVGTPAFARLSDGAAALIGQKTMANSLPVSIASDQSALAVPTLTKGTQAATGYSVQPLKDAGRNSIVLHVQGASSQNADTLASLSGYKSGAFVAATTTPAVVTSGKTLRIESLTFAYGAIATAGSVRITLRANLSGVVAIGSPLVAQWSVGCAAPATAGAWGSQEVPIPDGFEFPAGAGIGFSVLGLSTVLAGTAVGFYSITLVGYEY